MIFWALLEAENPLIVVDIRRVSVVMGMGHTLELAIYSSLWFGFILGPQRR